MPMLGFSALFTSMGGISSPLLFGRGEATWRAQPTKIFLEKVFKDVCLK